jgi:Spy/CpxP family protein refolding chaperone
MRTVGTITLCCLLLACGPETTAQILTDSVGYSETLWRMEKRKLVLDNMELTEAEKACFWPLYENYTNSIEFVEGQCLEILAEYESASVIEHRELEKLSLQLMENDLYLAKHRKQFYKKLSKALSPEHATRFLALDDTLRQMLRLKIKAGNNNIPGVHASLR